MISAIVAVSVAIASAPYVAFALRYGSPTPDTPAQIELLRSGAATTGWGAEPRLGALAYTFVFLRDFLAQWMPSLQPRNAFQLALLVLPGATLVLAAAGTLLSLRAIRARPSPGETEVMIAAGMLAIIATLIVHIIFSYQRHLQTGWMLSRHRHYLPMIAIVPLAAAITFVNAISAPRKSSDAVVVPDRCAAGVRPAGRAARLNDGAVCAGSGLAQLKPDRGFEPHSGDQQARGVNGERRYRESGNQVGEGSGRLQSGKPQSEPRSDRRPNSVIAAARTTPR